MEEHPTNFEAANYNDFFAIHYSNFFRLKFPSKAMNAFLQPDKSWLIITLLINLYPAYICLLSPCHSVCSRAGGVPQPCPNLFTWGPPSSSSSPSPKLFKFVYLGSPNPDLFSVGKRVAGLRLKRLLVSIISAELYLLCPWKRKIFLNILVPNDPTEWISKIKWSLPFLYTISWFSSIILKMIKIFSH